MEIIFKPAPRKSISDTIKNIEDLISQSQTTKLPQYKNPPPPPKQKMKSVLKDCEDMLSSKKKLEKQSFGLLKMPQNFFKPSSESLRREVSHPIMMLNQPNVIVNTKDIKQSIDELELSKTKFERLKRYSLDNERALQSELKKPNGFFEDFYILPTNYINNARNKNQKILYSMNSSQNGVYNETFFVVKSQNNFIAVYQPLTLVKGGEKITQGKLLALKIFNSFLKKNDFLGTIIEPKTIKSMIKHRNPNVINYRFGFHEDVRYNEGIYSEEDQFINKEAPKEVFYTGPDENLQEKARLEMEDYSRQMKKKRIRAKLERNPRVLEVLALFLKSVYLDAAMPFKYKRKKSLNFNKYEFVLQENVKNFARKNKKSVKKERNIEIKRLEDARENQVISGYKLDFFDFSEYPHDNQLDLNIGPAEERPDLGSVTLAAPIYKQIKNTDKVHFRWLVLRGFNLYWYRSADHSAAKGIIHLPTKPIIELMINKRSMFKLPEGLGRNLTFELKDSGSVWRRLLANQIAFRYYYDVVDKEKMKVSCNLVRFFENEGSTKLDLSDLGFRRMNAYNESALEGKLEIFIDLLTDSLVYHNKLRELNLAKAMIGPGVLQNLIGSLSKGVWNFRLETLNLERNAMNFQALVALEKYLISDNSFELKYLYLNYNDLYDQGVMHLSQTLYNRHVVMLNKKIERYNLPLHKLGLINVKMSDQGFFGLINQLEKIHKLNKNKGIIEYASYLELHISENLISDNSIKGLCHLLEDFNGINILEMGKCKKIKGYIFKTLLNVLKNNYSILYLNYEENEIDLDGFQMLLDLLEENYIIKKLKFTIPYSLCEKMLGSIRQTYQFFHIAE